MVDLTKMASLLREAAEAAGLAILAMRAQGCETRVKADNSPVTQADHKAEAIILEHIRRHYPQIPYLAEEACAQGLTECAIEAGFFLIDPLDGTREFIAGRDEFTVNIAYVQQERPKLGLVHIPATGESFAGFATTAVKWQRGENTGRAIAARAAPPEGAVALVSRSHRTPETEAFLAAQQPASVVPMGSSQKFCRLAEGVADFYPCLGTTMEWDTAAGEAVLEAAGGSVRTLDGAPLIYGKHANGIGRAGFANPYFVARGK